MQLLSPKNDVVFQKLFGRNENKDILISFLNSIIIEAGNIRIADVKIEEKKIDVSMLINEKISILDIYVTTDIGTHINIEMQIINEYNMIKRTLYYWSKMFLKQLVKGENYSKLEKTITINLIDFNIDNSDNVHNYYHLINDKTNKRLTDIMEIHFIDMKKFREHGNIDNDKLEKWLQFIEDPNGEESDSMASIDSDIGKAKEILSLLSCDDDVKALAELREKALMDEKSRIDGALKKNTLEIANNLLDVLDDETIALKTGLSIEEVKVLRK